MMANKLSEEEIYSCLLSFNVIVRKQDIKAPSKEFMLKVFECFLKDLQIDLSNPSLRTWNATSHIKEMELYEDVITLVLLVRIINHIFEPSKMRLSIKDITDPKPKRTKKILIHIIVFWTHLMKKYSRFQEIVTMFEDDKVKVDNLVTNIEALEEKYNELLDIIQNMEPCREELLSIIQTKKEKADKLEEKKVKIMDEYQALKTQEVELRNDIRNTNVDIVSAKEKLEEVGQLILSSPDRFKHEIQKLQEKLKIEELKIKNKDKEAEEKRNHYQDLEKVLEWLNKALVTLQEINEAIQKICKEAQLVASDVMKVEEEEHIVKKLQSEIDRKSEWNNHFAQTSAKVILNTFAHKQSLIELLDEQERLLHKEQQSEEFLEKKHQNYCLTLRSIEASMVEMRETYKKVQSEVNKKKADYKKRTQDIQTRTCYDVAELKEALM